MKRRKKCSDYFIARLTSIGANTTTVSATTTFYFLTLLLLVSSHIVSSIPFNGIPAAFGDLDFDKRTDIVVIGDDGTLVNIWYQHQHQRQTQPPFDHGRPCRSDKPVVQVYLVDIDNDGNPNLLALILSEQQGQKKIYRLKSLRVQSSDHLNSPQFSTTKLTSETAYIVENDGSPAISNKSNNSLAESLPLKTDNCEFTDLGVEMTAQPLLFDLDGDLQTDFMSLDRDETVCVWKPPKPNSNTEKFEKMPLKDWSFIPKEYFISPHSNSFIDINNDYAADIVLSGPDVRVAYLVASTDVSKSFKDIKEFTLDNKIYEYGQSALVDINADGKIDHVIPRCHKIAKQCEIVVLFENGRSEIIFKFYNKTGTGDSRNSHDYRLERIPFAKYYEFPITLRAADLDGDGYTDFVTVAKNMNENQREPKNKVVYLHNIPDPEDPKHDSFVSGAKTLTRTFEIQEIPSDTAQEILLVTLFDINEDGKIDMLIGSSEHKDKPHDMNVTVRMNTQMVDACFMKVLVTNGIYSGDAGSNGQSARGPFICFGLSQNDGKKMQGCAGQLSQSSHFALQSPYVIFGLGQTPHFVEVLNVTIPGYGTDGRVRTRLLEQIVPDAQVIIIPKQKDNPNSWDYKMFLSPMSDLVFSTLVALAVLCILILFIIFFLHRLETLEDAAEHEEYKRHWPESR